MGGEFIHQRAFARARRARHADEIGAAGEGKKFAQQILGARIGIFDGGDGARNRARIPRAHLGGPIGDALRHWQGFDCSAKRTSIDALTNVLLLSHSHHSPLSAIASSMTEATCSSYSRLLPCSPGRLRL